MIAPGIAVGGQELDELLRRELDPLGQGEQHAGEALQGRQALQQGRHGGDQQRAAPCSFGQPTDRVDAPGDDVAMGRDPVIGQAVPGRERHDLEGGGEEAQGLDQPRHARVVDADMEHLGPARERGQDASVESFRHAGQGLSAWPVQNKPGELGPRLLGEGSVALGQAHAKPSFAGASPKLAARRRQTSAAIISGGASRPISQS